MSVLKTYRPGALSALFSQGASALGGFLAFLFLANMLSKDDLGAYSFAFNVMILLSILATLGLDRALLLRLSRDGDPGHQKRGLRLLFQILERSSAASIVFIVAVWAIATPLSEFMGSQVAHWWLSALAPVILPMAVLLLLRVWFQANHRFAIFSAMPGIVDFLRAMFIGVAFVAATGKLGVALAVFAGFCVPLVALLLLTRGAEWIEDTRLESGDVSRGIVYAFQRISEAGFSLFDVILIGLVASDATTAEFALAARLAVLADAGRQAVFPTFMPRVRRYHMAGERAEIAREFGWVRLLSLLAALGVAILLIVFGPAILLLFGGYEAAYEPLILIVAGYVVTGASGPHLGYLTMTGEVRLPALIRLGGLIVTAVGIVFTVPIMGALGAGFAILVGLLAVNSAALAALWAKTGFIGVSGPVHGLTLIAVMALCAVALHWISPMIGATMILVVVIMVEELEYGVILRLLHRS
ncbi:MAG: oligosaccharide flippase family protein [Phaeobacter gallaeciensis]